jgi:hypothetical protein
LQINTSFRTDSTLGRRIQAPFSFRAASIVVRNTVSSNDFKTGMTVEIDGVPFKVIGERRLAAPSAAVCCAPGVHAKVHRRWRAGIANEAQQLALHQLRERGTSTCTRHALMCGVRG